MQTISPQQILVPKKVYIGDSAELRCTFNSQSLILREITECGPAELSPNVFYSSEYEIKSITISSTGVDFYQLSISFSPWKTG